MKKSQTLASKPSKPSKSSVPSLDFFLRLSRAQAVVVRRLDNTLGSIHGLSFNDFQLLLYLQRAPAGKLRRIDLAERLALTASGVTRQLLPLEKIGLVSRQADPTDARVGYAQITSSGAALLLNATKTAEQLGTELLQARGLESTNEMNAVLEKIAGMNLSNS